LVNPFGFIITRELNSEKLFNIHIRISATKRIHTTNVDFFDYIYIDETNLHLQFKPKLLKNNEKNNFYIPQSSSFEDTTIISYTKDMLYLLEQKKNSSV
jgi:hypothetical protein